MRHPNHSSAPLWSILANMPSFTGSLMTETNRQALVDACQRDFDVNLTKTLSDYNKPSGGLILPERHFDDLMGRNGRVNNHGKIYRKTLWALYRDMLDRDGTSLFWRMYECNRDSENGRKQNRCNSLFCPACRTAIQKRRQSRAKDKFSDTPHNQLYFLTVLHKCVTELNDVKKDIASFKSKMKRTFKKADHLSSVETQGAMEIDLKHPWLYNQATLDGDRDYRKHCAEALGAMGINFDDPECPDKFWLIHYHAIVDIGVNDPDQIKEVLKSAFTGNHRVRLESFHSEDKTPKDTSLDKCASYPLKSKLQYAVNIYADDPDKNSKTCYSKEYSPEDMAYLCCAIDKGGNLQLMKYDFGSRGKN